MQLEGYKDTNNCGESICKERDRLQQLAFRYRPKERRYYGRP